MENNNHGLLYDAAIAWKGLTEYCYVFSFGYMEKCLVLKEYSQLMAKIREYQDRDESDAYKKAVKDCISQGILEEYLRRKGSEVCNMLIADCNYELDIKVQREEAWEDGRDTGLREGHDRGLKDGQRIMILKIYNKGKTLKEIADMFDEPLEEVEKIVAEGDNRIKE